jgi:putative methionine-R-sulfoxide reductase with GAF domain
LRARGIIDDPIDSSEDREFDEFDDEFIEHIDNQRW